MYFLRRFKNANTLLNPQQLKRCPMMFAIARLLGLAPFSFVVENSTARVNPSSKWLMYSVTINIGLALLSIKLTLEASHAFFANTMENFAVVYRVNSVWLCHSFCVVRGKRLLISLRKLYSLSLTESYAYALYNSVGAVIYASAMLYGIAYKRWLWGALVDRYGFPYVLGHLLSFAVNTGFVAFFADTVCTLCECLKALKERVVFFEVLKMHDVNFIGSQREALYLDSTSGGLRRRYIEIFNISSTLEDCFCFQFVLLILEAFFQTTFSLYYTLIDYDGLDILLGVCSVAGNIWLLALLFTAGQRSIDENNNVAIAVSEALALSYLPPSVRQELHDLSLQMLHLRLRFTACGFFPLDYPQLHTVIAAVTTYLVILLQTHNTTEEPNGNINITSVAANTGIASANAIFDVINSSTFSCA